MLFLHFSIQLPTVTQNLTHPLHVGNFLLHLPRIAIGERTSLQEGSWCKLLNQWHMGRCFLEPKTLPLSPSDQLENGVVLTQIKGVTGAWLCLACVAAHWVCEPLGGASAPFHWAVPQLWDKCPKKVPAEPFFRTPSTCLFGKDTQGGDGPAPF